MGVPLYVTIFFSLAAFKIIFITTLYFYLFILERACVCMSGGKGRRRGKKRENQENPGCLDGTASQATDFSSGYDLRVLGLSPGSGYLLSR